MDQSLSRRDSDRVIAELEEEVLLLEQELNLIETQINTFEAHIRSALASEIAQINRLTDLYKQLKLAKKNKRSLQKQKGKNYKPSLKRVASQEEEESQEPRNLQDTNHLKKLYKEAVMLVHPDKFEESDMEAKERAHDLTAELIGVYKSGNLERLIALHDHIMSGNAMSHVPFETTSIVDHQALEAYLLAQKETLSKALEKLKSTYIYEVLLNYENPLHFIEELRPQFAHRILQLQKRTRKA